MRTLSRRELLSFGAAASDDPDPLIHIASLLVQATPAGVTAVRELIAAMPEAEIHETAHAGKLAVVLESADGRAIAHNASELQQLSGVLTVSIVAHLTERASALEELDEPTSIPAQ